ncbi:ClpP/crotonase [Cryphonectria parasitica EP155]|uniref:ClpP/crotonase n=1 Tax=Cryphonectria parasitica (strain ATCC 38755 / EP155) TaxID=660469 RepID=A0A9P4Y823_CRYP1|nr:ClpP/crotonase [Cryphonectria parasitica EP155]KAF3768134.1 ClpP/crotonase [Cryphonectria parasitica EP155]
MTLPEALTSPPPAVPNTLVTFPTPQILLVTLNRPKQLNAVPTTSHPLFDSLWRWYDAQPSLRCAVLTGTGRAFCAGADLKEWSVRNEAASDTARTARDAQSGGKMRVASGFAGLSNRGGKKPVIAAVNGLCLGGGMEVALNCDMILASEDAVFGLPEVKRGVIALAGALPRLVRTVGRQRAAEMALLGRHYSAGEMERWGVVNKVVPAQKGEVLEEALRWAAELAENSPDSVIVSREGLRLGWEPLGPEVGTDLLERGMYGRMDAGENLVEGVVSFVERRKPVWKDSKL